jgi:hypothetical protein
MAAQTFNPHTQPGQTEAAFEARYVVSNFVTAVLAHSFVTGVTINAMPAAQRWRFPKPLWATKTAAQPVMPMHCVIDAVMDICATSHISSTKELNETLAAIRSQFDVADECDDEDRAWVLATLEEVLERADQDARNALNEAQKGFPVSGASVARWVLRQRGVDA